MLVNYTKEDYTQVLTLWQEAFGDAKEDIDACLALFAQYLYVYKQEDKLLSMLMLLPLSFGDKKGEYVYAVATRKEARGMGLATKMLEEAKKRVEQHEIDFLALVPAKPSLFVFYEKRGFTAGTPLTTVTTAKNNPHTNINICKISPDAYGTLRQKQFPRLAAWSTQMLTDIETLYGECYYRLSTENGVGFCMAYMQKDKLSVSELCLNAMDTADALSILCKYFGAKKAEAKLPDEDGEPFAMFYPENYADLYFNLAIN